VRDALRAIRAAPWVGAGAGGFDDAYRIVKSTPDFVSSPHAHQELLQAAAEHGLIGASLWLGAVAALGAAAFVLGFRGRHGEQRRTASGFVGSLVVMGAAACWDFPLRVGALAVLVALDAGVVLGLAAASASPGPARGGIRVKTAAIACAAMAFAGAGSAAVRWTSAGGTWGRADLARAEGDAAMARARNEARAATDDTAPDPERARGKGLAAALAEAGAAYSAAVQAQPVSREALQDLARVRELQGDPQGAHAALEAATAVWPTLPWAWRDLARFEAARGAWSASRAAWKRALANDMSEPEGRSLVAESLLGPGEPRDVAIEALPERADRLRDAAVLFDEAGDREEAEVLHRHAAALGARGPVYLADTLLHWDRPAEALALVDGVKGDCAALLVGGEALLRLAREAEAVQRSEGALDACGARDRRARLLLARARLATSDTRGLAVLERLVAEDALDVGTRRLLARELVRAGRSVDAVDQLQRLVAAGTATPDEAAALEAWRKTGVAVMP
jgi:hypothetical protein